MMGKSMLLIDLILMDLLTNMLAQFISRLRVTFYAYVERMAHKFSKIKSFRTNKYG